MPIISVARVGGGELKTGGGDSWQTVVVYRGKHCPLCRKYLTDLNATLDEFHGLGFRVLVISADTREKAEAERKNEGW